MTHDHDEHGHAHEAAKSDTVHDHDHDHGNHDHGHHHGPADYGRAFAIGVALNVTLVVAQAIYGVLANSVALLADAAHNLSDVLGLLLAWGATILAKRLPSKRFTYGLRSSSILAALPRIVGPSEIKSVPAWSTWPLLLLLLSLLTIEWIWRRRLGLG